MGIGDWGLGIGDWGLGPIPNPQSPIPNPQSPYIKNNLNNPYSRNSNNSNNNFNTNYQIAPYLHGKDYINFNNNLDQKKISKRKFFIFNLFI